MKLMQWMGAAALTVALACAAPAGAKPVATTADPALTAQAKDVLKRAIAFRTVQGQGQVPALAEYFAGVLKAGGFTDQDIKIERVGETAVLVARYRGRSNKPAIVLSGHMDVVEAFPKDWVRDPFTATEENGYIYGRGSSDMKGDDAMMIVTLVGLKKAGFVPSRDIVLALSGDEETEMASTQVLAKELTGSELVLNADAGGGQLAEDGKPVIYALQAAEKTYADYEITFSGPGGHSSRPQGVNVINELAQAIDKIGAYQFPAQSSELTRAFFKATAPRVAPDIGAAMLKFAADPADADAVARLRADPDYVGQVGTTCVATMLRGGHALNALPQSATVSVNCRIFPGVSVESVRQTLQQVIADPAAKVVILDHPVASDASPLRADVTAAVRQAVDAVHPGLEIVPQMSSGASDSLYFRGVGIPSYGTSGTYMKSSDDHAHGLDERIPVAAIATGLEHWRVLLTTLAK